MKNTVSLKNRDFLIIYRGITKCFLSSGFIQILLMILLLLEMGQ